MAKKPDLSEIFKKTEPDQAAQPDQPEDPVSPRGVGLRASEWQRLEEIAGELGMRTHALAMWAIRDFIRRYGAGEIPTDTRKSLK